MAATDDQATRDLDEASVLPTRNKRSFQALVAVQALNAFNDNFVKMLLIAFAGVIAKGTDLGSSMQLYLGAIFALPYVLFAPVAGWLSDRFSKQKVILWMQVVQVFIFGLFHLVLMLRDPQLSLWLALGCFFLLATQSALFSPAKMGVVKEIVGSRRLGSTTGTMQLTNFMGILSGMGLAGWWFGSMIEKPSSAGQALTSLETSARMFPELSGWFQSVQATVQTVLHTKAWDSVNWLVGLVSVIAILQIIGAFFIQKTPEHPRIVFYRGLWLEHFTHLKLLFSQRPLLLAAIGISYFWFMSNAVGSILITLSHELHPQDGSAAAKAMSVMPAMLGIGVMAGSVIAGIICRKRIELGLVPISGYLLAASLLWSGLAPVNPWINMALIGIGLAGGAFMTPLYAFVQDRSRPEERARIMSAINLMDCVSGIAANLILVKTMLMLKMPSAWQLLVLVPVTLAAALFITKLLPRNLLMLVVGTIIRTFYRVNAHHAERMPKQGGVLILPNHVSYADALMLGVSCERKIRFVMLESLYKIKSIQWGLKIFGTVPISASRAKEAIRTVADALKEDQAVALFPEGQLTRNGFLNEVRKGYELMARLGSKSPVQPVWLDGLWGSVFSFEGGRFFKKKPKAFPYRVNVWYGEPIPADEASPQTVREALTALSKEAFVHRVQNLMQKSKATVELYTQSELNALRILDTALLNEVNRIHCLLEPEHPLATTFTQALPQFHHIEVISRDAQVTAPSHGGVMAVGTSEDFASISSAKEQGWDLMVVVLSLDEAIKYASSPLEGVMPALYDAGSGTLLSLSVPDPVMPKGEEGRQQGHKKGALGHLLNGLAQKAISPDELHIHGAGVNFADQVVIKNLHLDDEGFFIPVVTKG